MEEILAYVDDIQFDVEVALEQQIGLLPLPFPGEFVRRLAARWPID